MSWWLQRRKLLAEGNDEEKDVPNAKTRTVEISDKNVEILEGLLSNVAGELGTLKRCNDKSSDI